MHRTVTTLLDLAGLLLLAAGAYWLVEPTMSRSGLLVAGGVLLVGSQIADRAANPRSADEVRFVVRLRARVAAWRARRQDEAAT